MCLQLQAELREMKDELTRVQTQRTESDKENETLRNEIRRMKVDFEQQWNNKFAEMGKGGLKTDVGAQTDNFEIYVSNNIENNIVDRTEDNGVTEFEGQSSYSDKQDDSRYKRREEYSKKPREGICGNNERHGDQNDFMRGIVSYFDSLQVTIPLPKFDGLNKNPIEFISDIEKYFTRKNISENLQLVIIEEALIGKARMWHDARSFPFINYQHFKNKFLEEFYSIEARMMAKSEWESRRYKSNENSLQGYYVEQLSRAKFCLSSLKEFEVNYLIIKQLPQRVREVLSTIDYNDTSRIMQALNRLDATRRDIEGGISSKNKNNTESTINNSNHNKFYKQNNQNEGNTIAKNNGEPTGQQQSRSRNFESDRQKNWRQPGQSSNNNGRAQYVNTNDKNEDRSGGNNIKPSSSINAMWNSNISEFIDDLCWDVVPGVNEISSEIETKIVSPRIRATIENHEVAVLVDSGSEVTAISENFYNSLKKHTKIIELPVSNITVSVAVGKKSTTIRRQVQLTLKIENNNFVAPFLIVPGLATNVLVGINWLLKFKCMIDIENQKIQIAGNFLPESLVTFKMSEKREINCRIVTATNEYNNDRENSNSEQEIDGYNIQERSSNDIESEQVSYNMEEFAQEIDEYLFKLKSFDKASKQKIKDILIKYRRVFSKRPGCTNVYEHRITLEKQKTIVRKSYPVALSRRDAVRKAIHYMLGLGILEISYSDCCNPLRIVFKKNGDVRLCLDARFINVCIKSDNESPPIMEELLQKFEGAKFLSTTDLVMGYWQIPLEEESRKYTAFLFKGHLYQFTRVPFGLKTAESGFIRALNIAL
ncbi:uncharacterized protein LOC122510544 isoform X2 [Leptopilina heterotoma]|nr:uncharacterized protein LOC122510544 isoform X2 [Leptopilina heterotoma]XP_043481229.1 uncharacterized protein LOC122510544 isoform X2 [Leptopilina heterotoma]